MKESSIGIGFTLLGGMIAAGLSIVTNANIGGTLMISYGTIGVIGIFIELLTKRNGENNK